MTSNRRHLDFIFSNQSISQVQDYLRDNPRLNIAEFRDEKRNNILHQNAFNNKLALMKIYIEHMTKVFDTGDNKKNIRHQIQAWVNETNSEGFTPVHYASFKGNLEMIKFLESVGASLLFLTKLGLNMIHLAAQGDRLNVLIYLHDTFDLNIVDNKKSTPLHWACYMGSENVVAFLLAIPTVQIDVYDAQQQTPLHLATSYGNTKIVRRLLIKGADRTLRNNKGKTPIQIARENQFRNITKMLNDQFTFMDQVRFYCNLKMEYKPMTRTLVKPTIFLLSLVLLVGSSHVLIQPDIHEYYLSIPAVYYLILLILYCSLIISPKPIEKQFEYKQLLDQLPICVECRIPKLRRSYHCDICRICITNYDHHCPWINNCVGRNNLVRFIVFLVMLIIGLFEIATVSIFGIIEEPHDYFKGFRFISENDWIKYIYKIIFGINTAVFIAFIVPVFILLYVQLNNLTLNQTTFQRFSKSSSRKNGSDRHIDSESSGDHNINNRLLKQEPDELTGKYAYANCVKMYKEETLKASISSELD